MRKEEGYKEIRVDGELGEVIKALVGVGYYGERISVTFNGQRLNNDMTAEEMSKAVRGDNRNQKVIYIQRGKAKEDARLLSVRNENKQRVLYLKDYIKGEDWLKEGNYATILYLLSNSMMIVGIYDARYRGEDIEGVKEEIRRTIEEIKAEKGIKIRDDELKGIYWEALRGVVYSYREEVFLEMIGKSKSEYDKVIRAISKYR